MSRPSGDQKKLLRTLSSSAYTQSTSPFREVSSWLSSFLFLSRASSVVSLTSLDSPETECTYKLCLRTKASRLPSGENLGSSFGSGDDVSCTPVPVSRSKYHSCPCESKRRCLESGDQM